MELQEPSWPRESPGVGRARRREGAKRLDRDSRKSFPQKRPRSVRRSGPKARQRQRLETASAKLGRDRRLKGPRCWGPLQEPRHEPSGAGSACDACDACDTFFPAPAPAPNRPNPNPHRGYRARSARSARTQQSLSARQKLSQKEPPLLACQSPKRASINLPSTGRGAKRLP